MKKILLSLLCLISFMAINAETYTFNMKDKHGASSISTLTEWTEGVFTFTPKKENGQTNPAYNKSGDVRIYAKGTFTIECANAKMKNISFTISSQGKKRMTTITSNKGQMTVTGANDYTCSWAGDANAVTFTVGDKATLGTENTGAGQFCFTDITIETGAADAVVVAKPTFSVAGGVFTEPFDLTLSAEDGNTIYFTLDGSNPTVDSDIFDGEAIRISEYTEVKATAVNAQGVASNVATATYAFQNTVNTAMTVAEALAWIEEGKDATTEQYIAGYITAIKNVNLQYGNAEYSIADAINGTDALLVYRGNYLNDEKFTAEDQIKVGDKVLIYGKLKDYNGTPEVDSYSYIVSFLEKAPDEGGEEPGDDPVVPETPSLPEGTLYYESFNNCAGTGGNDGVWKAISGTPEIQFDNANNTHEKGYGASQCARFGTGSAQGSFTTAALTGLGSVQGGYAILTFKAAAWNGDSNTIEVSIAGGGEFIAETSLTTKDAEWTEYSLGIAGGTANTTITISAVQKSNNRFFLDEVKVMASTEDKVTGIEDTMADENAPVEYYNLQGVKVANPENGIFIKKQGTKATKVVL